LQECLTAITASVARLHPSVRAAVILPDEAGEQISRVVSSDIPQSFEQGLRGAPICELAIGTCGTAIYEGRPVSCADIANDTEWSKPWRDLCVAHGVLACYSTPVFGVESKSIASFFLCFGEVHDADEWDRSVGQFGAHIAGIAIDREAARERQKRAEAALRKSERFAAAGRMAATIAHEINNPLEAIVNLCYLLSQENLSPAARDLVRSLDTELDRVSHIAKQTLEFYRNGKSGGPIDLAQPINAAIGIFSRKANASGVKIETDYRTSSKVFGFAGELRQVFANLIDNALEAGSTIIRIRVSPSHDQAREGRPGLRVVIADNGSGVPADSVTKIFQPFFTTKEEKGTGLGLWVSKGIVQKHEGWIRMHTSTQPGRRGTTFCMFLPTLHEGPLHEQSN
jgi:signal transduction histidine kinase